MAHRHARRRPPSGSNPPPWRPPSPEARGARRVDRAETPARAPHCPRQGQQPLPLGRLRCREKQGRDQKGVPCRCPANHQILHAPQTIRLRMMPCGASPTYPRMPRMTRLTASDRSQIVDPRPHRLDQRPLQRLDVLERLEEVGLEVRQGLGTEVALDNPGVEVIMPSSNSPRPPARRPPHAPARGGSALTWPTSRRSHVRWTRSRPRSSGGSESKRALFLGQIDSLLPDILDLVEQVGRRWTQRGVCLRLLDSCEMVR